MNAMVVEDNPIIREEFANQFRRRGWTVTEAGDGDEALHVLASGEKFDLIVTDMKMPVMNGECLVRRAKANGLLHCPVVAVTAFPEENQHGKELLKEVPEFKGMLRKVLDTDDLPAAVEAKLAGV